MPDPSIAAMRERFKAIRAIMIEHGAKEFEGIAQQALDMLDTKTPDLSVLTQLEQVLGRQAAAVCGVLDPAAAKADAEAYRHMQADRLIARTVVVVNGTEYPAHIRDGDQWLPNPAIPDHVKFHMLGDNGPTVVVNGIVYPACVMAEGGKIDGSWVPNPAIPGVEIRFPQK